MDEDKTDQMASRVGDQLKAARKRKKMSLEDIASQTRIPLRHLESIESSDWEHLPAPTYSVGFAKSYAAVVGLDKAEIGDLLRAEMGGSRPVATVPEVFEPADPARAMPKVVVIGAIIAAILVVALMSYLNRRSLDSGGEARTAAPAVNPTPAQPPPLAAPAPQGPVVLSASEPLWIAVYEAGGASYFSGMLQPGADFTVPASASAPLIKTAKPEALKILVGTAVAPAIGPPGLLVSDISLLPGDLLKTTPTPTEKSPATTG